MNVLFLLLVAIAILLMSHRFWGRMLGAVVFPPLPAMPAAAPGGGGVALDIAASGGVLSLVGTGLALGWGWAPVYAWILLACAFGAPLMRSALQWLAGITGAKSGLDGAERLAGTGLANALRTALAVALVVWMAVASVMLASLLVSHPAAAVTLLLQVVMALVLSRWLGDSAGAAGAGVVLVAGVAAVPAGIALLRVLPDPRLPAAGTTLVAAVTVLSIVVALALVRAPRRRLLKPLSLLVVVGLVVLLLLASAAVVIEHPAAGFLGYFSTDGHPGAVPLIAACAGVGVLPLLGALTPDPTPADKASPVAAATFEGLLASVLLAALLCAPVLMAQDPIGLPDWNAGIEPGAVAAYGVAALAALGERLPVSTPLVADAVASVMAGLLAMLLIAGAGALRRLAADLAPAAIGERGIAADAAVAAALGAAAALTMWRGSLPVDVWLIAGQLALLFGAALTAVAAFASARLRRGGGRTAGAWGALLGVLFWWSCLQQLVAAALGGRWWIFALQAATALLGLFITAAVAAAYARLAGARQAA